jgi:thiol:disulfide interchange protein DsbD
MTLMLKHTLKHIYNAVFFISISFIAVAAKADVLPLPAEKAFVFSAHLDKANQLVAEWQVAPGYFLYRDKLHFNPEPKHPSPLGAIEWPASQDEVDPIRGTFRAYEGKVSIVLPLKGKAHQEVTLAVQYQGCSQDGFCYAPMKKLLHLTYPFSSEGLNNAPLLTITEAQPKEVEKPMLEEEAALEESLLTDQGAAKAFLGNHALLVSFFCFLGLGLLLAFTPCSLPMIPILSSLIVGQQNQVRRNAFKLSLAYVLGMALTYAAAGLLIAWLGSSIQAYFQNPWVISGFSLLFVLLALSMLDLFQIRLPSAWQQRIAQWQAKQTGGSYLGAFLMGALSTLIVSPCVTAPLVGVLAYISETGNLFLGGSTLFALGLGLGLPLLLLGFSAGKYLPKAGPWMEVIKKLFAFLLFGMAIWMLTRILPGGVTLFLWAGLLMSLAIFCFFVEGLKAFWQYSTYLAGVLFLVYGFVLFVGVAMSYTSPFYPFERLALGKSAVLEEVTEPASKALDFTVIKSMKQLDALLKKAKSEGMPVMVDFYADWCESCQAVEKAVMSEAKVQTTLHQFVLLRANVTDNNAFDQALLKRYHVVAPPTFLFFNRKGQEVMEKRIVGEVNPHLFLARASAI